MPINTDLLIAAPMLQDYFSDKNGVAMVAGTITCYHDNSRTTLKNWYYQTGTPGAYIYLPLPNPLTLSAAGTITDINGVDTIPFFYPYLETDNITPDPYYITIVNHAQTNQITRANFPFLPPQNNSPLTEPVFTNLIVNNGFWRNVQPNTLNVTPYATVDLSLVTAAIVAPSQHDGFSMHDVVFLKTNTTGTDILTFTPFPVSDNQPINNDIVPEYYINHQCTSPNTGNTQKCYQFPIALHINNLANVNYTVTIQAQNAGSTGAAGTIELRLLQFTGTGTSSPVPQLIANTPIVLTTSWKTWSLTAVFPTAAGLPLGQGADDAYYLQVQMPLNLACNINFTKPSIYLTTDQVPGNDFQTYSQVDTVINGPRTGDIRVSVNQFYPFGWAPMNDSVIGLKLNGLSANAYSRANTDTWPLYKLIYEYAQPFDTGANSNLIAQLYTNTGASLVATNYTGNAYTDFIANKALALTRMMGQALLGTVPVAAVVGGTFVQTMSGSNSGGKILITMTNSAYFFNGQPVTFSVVGGTLPDALVANRVYFVANLNLGGANTFNVALTFTDAMAGTVINWGSTPGSGAQFVTSNRTGTETGEPAHVQLEGELATHSHPGSTIVASNFITGAAAGATTYLTPTGSTAVSVAPDGSSRPINITQLSTFYNMFIKL